MAVGVIDHRAGMDAARGKRGRIEIRRQAVRRTRIDAVGAGENIVQQGEKRPFRVHAPTSIIGSAVDDRGPADDAVAVPGEAFAAHAIDVSKRQAVLPGVIGPQQVGKLGAVGVDIDHRAVAARVRVGAGAQAALGRVAARLAQRRDESAKAALILGAPMILGDAPWCSRGRTGQGGQQGQGEKDSTHPAIYQPQAAGDWVERICG